MKRNTTILFAALLLSAIVPRGAFAKNVSATDRYTKEFPLDVGGEFWIDNPVGNIEIVGQDAPGCFVTSSKVMSALDDGAMKEARDLTQLRQKGDQRIQLLQTLVPAVHPRWTSSVHYQVRIPRTANVKVTSGTSERIRIVNIAGNVTVKNFNGEIRLERVTGASVIDSVNGNIVYDYGVKPSTNAQLSTLNGYVMCIVPADSSFEWVADTINGDFLTTLPVRGRVSGTSFRGTVNSPGGPTVNTSSVMGHAILLRQGSTPADARSVRSQAAGETSLASSASMTGSPQAPRVQLGLVQGSWYYSTNVGDVNVAEIRGDARVETGAGSVHLGSVLGACNVASLGGPIDLGDIFGLLAARTSGGNVIVHAARSGGQISTGGGIIRLIYSGAPVTLRSGGGDIVVRQAAAAVSADTRSGDINITADPSVRSEKIDARTIRGNVILNLTSRFGADIDATVLTSSPDENGIHSDFGGLSVKREQVGTKTRIRATGKINGGGERVELYAEEGDIHISQQSTSPMTISPAP